MSQNDEQQKRAYNPVTPTPPVSHLFSGGTESIRPVRVADERETHQQRHRNLTSWMQTMISSHRRRVGIESFWTIHAQIKCPGDLPYSEGQVTWHADHNVAIIELRCDFEENMATHILIHELFELQDWETAETFITTLRYVQPEVLRTVFLDQYRVARNRRIESQVTRYTGHPRPAPTTVYYEEVSLDTVLQEESPAETIHNTMKQTAIRINTSSQPLM